MFLYLSTNTFPNITFDVSQVACFTHSPKKSHGIAVKMIIWYIKGTMSQGTIINKFHSLDVEGYSDADFCGLIRYDPGDSVIYAKTCDRFIIKVAGCPLIWKCWFGSLNLCKVFVSAQQQKANIIHWAYLCMSWYQLEPYYWKWSLNSMFPVTWKR